MADVSRSEATLRFSCDDLEPEEITALLCAQPDRALRKGEAWRAPRTGSEIVARTGMWHKRSERRVPWDLDAQIAELLGGMTQNLDIWAALAARFRMDLFAGIFLDSMNEGMALSPRTLRLLGERRLELGLDIYGPAGDR